MSLTFLSPLAALLALAVLVPLAALRAGEARAGEAARSLGLPPARRPVAVVAALAVVAGLLGLAAAQPVVVLGGDRLVRTDAQVLFVLDTTRSMLASASPGAPTRWDRAVEASLALRAELADFRVGIVSFTDRLLPHLLPSADDELFAATLVRSVGVDLPPPEGIWNERATSFGALAALATHNFYAPFAERRLAILVTDGETRGYSAPALAAVLGREPAVRLLVLHVHDATEQLFDGDGRPDPLYASDPGARLLADELAEAVRGAVFDEGQVEQAAQAAVRALGSGPREPGGADRAKVQLAPWLALGCVLPLGFVLRRRNFA